MRYFLRLTLLFVVALVVLLFAFALGYRSADRLDPALTARLETLVARRADGGAALGARAPDAAADGADSDEASSSPTDPTTASDPAAPMADGLADAGFDTFWSAWKAITDTYGSELPDSKVITYGAIRGSLRALNDPYTLFSDPVDTEIQRPELEGEFSGIGAFVNQNDQGQLVIQTPMRGQPAEKAGIKSGDIVLKVDGRDIAGLETNEAVLLIRGKKGTRVVLTLLREGTPEPFDVGVVRDTIKVPSVNTARLLTDEGAPTVGYIELTVFAQETRDEMRTAIRDLREAGMQALVLDLRNNPGGYLNAAIGVTSEFVESGVVTYREDRAGVRNEERVVPGGTAYDVPLVVLVNGGSASASEIVAGAIRDHDRGVLVGEQTFGKGSVQNVHHLSDGSELRVTVEIWRTPDGSLIHRRGIAPTILVTPPPQPTPLPTPTGATPAPSATPEPTPSPAATAVDGAGSAGDDAAPDDAGAGDAPDADAPPDVQLERAVEEALRLLGAR